MPPRMRVARPGLSLLECMLAVGILGLAAAMVAGALGYAYNAQARERATLGAAELGSTLILQYLDEKESMPASGLPLAYGPTGAETLYRWDLSDRPVRLTNNPNAEVRVETANANAAMTDRFRQVTVRVWLGEQSGGSFRFEPGAGSATLTRLYHPLAFEFRSPDSLQKLVQTEEGIRRLMEQILGAGDAPIELGTVQSAGAQR